MSTSNKILYLLFLLITGILTVCSIGEWMNWSIELKSVIDFGTYDYIHAMCSLHLFETIYFSVITVYLIGKLIFKPRRKMSKREEKLFLFLMAHTKIKICMGDLRAISVSTKDISGSIRIFYSNDKEWRDSRICVSKCRFIDSDGVMATASLMIDAQGKPFEIEFIKEDCSKLIRIPSDFSVYEERCELCDTVRCARWDS